jgi:hypothetical protein
MQCWHCGTPATGVCRFCGRAVCKTHATLLPYILTIYIGAKKIPKAVVVADVLYCGICKPQPEPIEMPEIL